MTRAWLENWRLEIRDWEIGECRISTQMDKEFNVIIEKDEEGYFVATVPALKGCHTQAKSLDELMKRTKEAIELCLEEEMQIFYPSDFIGVQKIVVKDRAVGYEGEDTAPKLK